MQLTNHTASELLERLNSGSISAVEVADEVINKIGETGNLGAIAAFDPNAYRVQAEASDRRRAREEAGCLDGIPLVLKDNINTADLPTTGGTGALVGMIPTKDAPAAAALRREGAILAAKAVMHELAFGITSNNSVTGPARNPYKPSMIPGGSSGGTAAAVSARQFPAGLGTDTGGSVRIPSALCGLIGFRPSVGRYAGEGVIPISNTRDTIGLIALSMADIRLLDGVMANRSASESKSRDVRSLRIGVPRTRLWENLEPGVEKLADDFMTRLAVEGVTFVEADFSEIWELNDNTGFPVALFEVMRNLPAYLEDAGYGVSFDDLLAGVGSPDVKGILSSQKGDEAMPAHELHDEAAFADRVDEDARDPALAPHLLELGPRHRQLRLGDDLLLLVHRHVELAHELLGDGDHLGVRVLAEHLAGGERRGRGESHRGEERQGQRQRLKAVHAGLRAREGCVILGRPTALPGQTTAALSTEKRPCPTA